MFRLRDREMSRKIIEKLEHMSLDLTLMHVAEPIRIPSSGSVWTASSKGSG